MLTQLLLMIINAIGAFIVGLLLVRFLMQWTRVSFRNQVGHFVTSLTDWLVLPLRRFVPGILGLDLATLVGAWLVQTLLVLVEVWLRGLPFGATALAGLGIVLVLGFFEILRLGVYVIIGIVLISAVLSWVNPYAPLAPLFNGLARPFLRPLQRVIPTVANIDLSPLVLLLLLQVVLVLLNSLRANLMGAMF
ncbi:MAG: YggT family protein [Betaproteobacteria bacterium]|nr:YggT family protein [Betaproteobacteria bacterium]